jgi:hypothetical protein
MSRKKRKGIPPGEKVPLSITLAQRDLIRDRTFAGLHLTDALNIAELKDKKIIAYYTLDDLDELAGYVAAAANHAKNRILVKRLEAVYDEIRRVEDSYYDHPSSGHLC